MSYCHTLGGCAAGLVFHPLTLSPYFNSAVAVAAFSRETQVIPVGHIVRIDDKCGDFDAMLLELIVPAKCAVRFARQSECGPSGRDFDATGILTLKGKTQTLTVPVTVTGGAGTPMVFDGALEISRAYFNLGDKEWNDVVDDKVRVRFHLIE